MSFGRPLHWIVALLGDEVVPVVYRRREERPGRPAATASSRPGRSTLESPARLRGRAREGPRDRRPRRSAAALVRERRQRRGEEGRRPAARGRGAGRPGHQPGRAAQPGGGHASSRATSTCPPEVLIQEMKSHQRYFSLVDAKGKLLPKFVAVSNTPVKDEQLSVRGYERVLQSRLSDGRFFFDDDRKTPLVDRVPKLLAGEVAETAGQLPPRRWSGSGRSSPGSPSTPATPSCARRLDRAALLCEGRPRHRHGGRVPRAAGRDGPRVRARRRASPRRWRWPSSSTTCRATRTTRCPRTTPARCSASPTGSTPCAASSASARCPPARRTRSACAAPRWR